MGVGSVSGVVAAGVLVGVGVAALFDELLFFCWFQHTLTAAYGVIFLHARFSLLLSLSPHSPQDPTANRSHSMATRGTLGMSQTLPMLNP